MEPRWPHSRRIHHMALQSSSRQQLLQTHRGRCMRHHQRRGSLPASLQKTAPRLQQGATPRVQSRLGMQRPQASREAKTSRRPSGTAAAALRLHCAQRHEQCQSLQLLRRWRCEGQARAPALLRGRADCWPGQAPLPRHSAGAVHARLLHHRRRTALEARGRRGLGFQLPHASPAPLQTAQCARMSAAAGSDQESLTPALQR